MKAIRGPTFPGSNGVDMPLGLAAAGKNAVMPMNAGASHTSPVSTRSGFQRQPDFGAAIVLRMLPLPCSFEQIGK